MAVGDIVTLGQVTTAYPNLDAGQLADAPQIISAVSAEISRRYPACSPPADFDEYGDPEFSRGFQLSRKPVIQIYRFRVDNWRVIFINYSGPARRAMVTTMQTGDVGSMTVTGLSITTETAGVTASPILLTCASYPTIGAMVGAINAVSGFTATGQPDMLDMASSDLEPAQGPFNAKVTTAWLYGFTRDINDFTCTLKTGEILMYEWRAPSYQFPDRVWGCDTRTTAIRVSYQAGRINTDPDVARAALIVIGDELEAMNKGSRVGSARSDDAGYTLSDPTYRFPDTAHRILTRFRERRFA